MARLQVILWSKISHVMANHRNYETTDKHDALWLAILVAWQYLDPK